MRFWKHFQIFLTTRGEPSPPDIPSGSATVVLPLWLCHCGSATVTESPFLGVCTSIQIHFPAAVTSLILQLLELYLHHWKA